LEAYRLAEEENGGGSGVYWMPFLPPTNSAKALKAKIRLP